LKIEVSGLLAVGFKLTANSLQLKALDLGGCGQVAVGALVLQN
jgi:hypothetical protein